MRLDKYIAKACGLSRSEAKKLIRSGNVSVNQQGASADTIIGDKDIVNIDGRTLSKPGPRYFMLNKPAGVVCANRDNLYDTAIDIFWQEPHFENLSCVGRLDIDTTGLLLVTDDGKWAHRISSPNSGCVKTYLAELDGQINEQTVQQFAQGILLTGEKKPTLPAKLEALGSNQAIVRIKQGKYHQVKRMFSSCGLEVLALHRSQIGNIVLDPDLEAGEYRELSEQEIKSV